MRVVRPPNKRMKLTNLSAAPGQMEAPPRAPHGQMEGRTGSQLIRGVQRTQLGTGGVRKSVSESRWLTVESCLRREDVAVRLGEQLAFGSGVRRRLSASAVVLSVSDNGFVLRAYGFWKRYGVRGTIEPAEFGSRLILEVSPLERLPAVQAVAAVLLALGYVPVVTVFPTILIAQRYWIPFRDPEQLIWPGAALIITMVLLGILDGLSTPRMGNKEFDVLGFRLAKFLHGKVVE